MKKNRQFGKAFEQSMSALIDGRDLNVHITIADAWVLVAGIQLACRHIEMPFRTKTRIREIASQFEAAIVAHHPEVKAILEAGWNSK